MNKHQWIIFDGDVDPEWVIDNKLLTLPNGERLSLQPNVKIMFEVRNIIIHIQTLYVGNCYGEVSC